MSIVFVLKLLIAIFALYVAILHLRKTTSQNSSQFDSESSKHLYLLMPLLRERAVLPSLFKRLLMLLENYSFLTIVFITTERERMEMLQGGVSTEMTVEVLQRLIDAVVVNHLRDRLVHLHYPKFNEVMADQLNFAIEEITSQRSITEQEHAYFVLYNADSVISNNTIEYFNSCMNRRILVVQQSSLFVHNLPALFRTGSWFTAQFGLYQSGWTLQHEIPRYLLTSGCLKWVPSWLRRCVSVHCVGHGLLIRSDVLCAIRGFPDFILGGDDLALGLQLNANNIPVESAPHLENTETPADFRILWKQLAGWFLACLGYLIYWKRLRPWPASKRIRVLALSCLGFYDGLKWLLTAPVMFAYLAIGILCGHAWFAISIYLIYNYIPVAAVLIVWYRQDKKNFPRVRVRDLVVSAITYWMIPILRSGPAVTGIVWGLRILFGYSFLKPKTERDNCLST